MNASPLSFPLTFEEYQARAILTDRTRDADGNLILPLLGLFGETGSLLSEAKKKHRDSTFHLGYEESVVEELGDVLWYLAVLADRAHIKLSDLAHFALASSDSNNRTADPGLTFNALGQVPTDEVGTEPTPNYSTTLLKLAGQVGLLLSRYEAGEYLANRTSLSSDLVSVLASLAHAANEAHVTLEQAARHNLDKIFDRWPQVRTPPPLFDEGLPSAEQIPRFLEIEVFERSIGGQLYVFQRCNGINIGDRLTDNIMSPDDYRFHDVFHYAFAAVLGWSPVLRALFRLKRKSVPAVDEGQDGARAVVIEEGVAALIFGYAKRLSFFATVKTGGLPIEILKSVRRLAAGYEPEHCPLWLWEESILQSYAAFRYLREHRRGCLYLDLIQRKLSIKEMSREP